MTLRALVLLALGGATAAPAPASAQALDQRIARVPDGEVRFSYAARPGVAGNGRNVISWDCDAGRCRGNQIEGHDVDGKWSGWRSPCDSGPVRIALTRRGTEVTRLRAYVGGAWRAADQATDLGFVGAPEAARYLLSLAHRTTSAVGDKAVFAATLADSVMLWPDLLRMARDGAVPRGTRRTAVFWLGHAADEAATRGLDELVSTDTVDREVREAAVFALSQQPRDVGVPALIRIARAHRDPEVRRKAIFRLGQSDDPRALALFEELLTKP